MNSRFAVGIITTIIFSMACAYMIVSQRSARQVERDMIRIGDTKLIAIALARYQKAHEVYPQGIAGGELDPYLGEGKIPQDPLGGGYPYEQVSGGSSYYLGANLETKDHKALRDDADSVGTNVEGSDADGCGNEANLYCYDIRP